MYSPQAIHSLVDLQAAWVLTIELAASARASAPAYAPGLKFMIFRAIKEAAATSTSEARRQILLYSDQKHFLSSEIAVKYRTICLNMLL